MTIVKNNANKNKLKFNFFKENSAPFPPSSYHSILKNTKEIPGILLTSYNKYYQSK